MNVKKVEIGFTLIELMIVVAIIAVLAGIAYPAYMASVTKSNRTEAKTELNDYAQRLQRCYTAYNAYNSDNCTIANTLENPVQTARNFYEITAVIEATTFTLTASPVVGGLQANDSKCTSFTITNTGAKSDTGSESGYCW